MHARTLTAAVILASASHGACAASAHVHGQGNLDIAVEGGRVELFFTAPLGDVTGDEGDDAAALEVRFADPTLFTFAGAACQRLSFEARVTTIGEDDAESFFTASADATDDHDHDAHDEHHDADDHAGHDEHEEHESHEDDDDHGGHRDARLTWVYTCAKDPDSVTANLFDLARVERIDVQAVGVAGVRSVELTAGDNSLALRK